MNLCLIITKHYNITLYIFSLPFLPFFLFQLYLCIYSFFCLVGKVSSLYIFKDIFFVISRLYTFFIFIFFIFHTSLTHFFLFLFSIFLFLSSFDIPRYFFSSSPSLFFISILFSFLHYCSLSFPFFHPLSHSTYYFSLFCIYYFTFFYLFPFLSFHILFILPYFLHLFSYFHFFH